MPSNTSRQIIVGVDFGTTYSGLAWTVAHRPERLATVTAWPDAADHEVVSEKVPTRLRYQGNDTQWGFKIPVNAPQHEILEWFKLYVVRAVVPYLGRTRANTFAAETLTPPSQPSANLPARK